MLVINCISKWMRTKMKQHTLNYNHTIYASYLGYITQAIVNNLAPLLFLIFQDEFFLSLSQITFITTLNFAVQLLVDLISARFVDKIGYRICIVTAHIFAAMGLVGMSVLPKLLSNSYTGLLLAVLLYAIGGGLIEVLISPIVEACPSKNKAAAMSLLHSFYCWGTVAVVGLSTLYLFLFGKGSWIYLPVIWSILPLANGIWFTKVPLERLTEENEGMSIKELLHAKVFWLFFMLMVAAGASEQAMSQWASAFAERGLGVSKTVGDLAGPCLFSVLMGLSRAFYGKFGEKINLLKFIRGSSLLCIAAYLIAVLCHDPVISLIGCGLCGLSVGIMWPGVFSIASARMPLGGTTMFALLALAGDVGCSGGPTIVGLVSGAFSENLKAGLLAAVIFPIIMFLCMWAYKIWGREKE